MRVRWVSRASVDLQEIATYLHANTPAAADGILHEIYEGAMSLGGMPYRGRSRAHGSMRELYLADRYILTYRIKQETVQILRVRQTSRKPLA